MSGGRSLWRAGGVRHHVTGQAALSPSQLARAITRSLREITERLMPARRLRYNPRVIKCKMSNWALKRTGHHNPPRPHTHRAPGRPDQAPLQTRQSNLNHRYCH